MAGIAMAGDGDDRKKAKVIADIDEDELFELDIALLDGRGDGCGDRGRRSAAAAGDDDDDAGGHALLANCLLPVRSVSNAVPVDDAGSSALSSYPYSGYYSSRRGGIVGRRFLARSAGNSARFCFSSRGFETYFQRY